uniref:PB1 domain-containing protein n=1 Tax=Ciona savignyi TaxID=51511 RepID=H2YT78_CIOSA
MAKVQYKVYLYNDNYEKPIEIRRFFFNSNAPRIYECISKKIAFMFPSLRTGKFCLQWKDEENELVSMSSDEEFAIALSGRTDNEFMKLYVTQQYPQPSEVGDITNTSGKDLNMQSAS